MQEATELQQLIRDLKTEPHEPKEGMSIETLPDRRTPEQRRLDFLNDLDALLQRDRMLAVPTQRHMPDGKVIMTVEWFPFTRQPNATDPPQ